MPHNKPNGMIVSFEKDYLKQLYEKGKTGEKKHRFQPQTVVRYKRCVDYLKAAGCKEHLFLFNSLHFEALKGDKAGLFSVRVDKQYRLEFRLQENAQQPVLTVCHLVELSNHYD